MTSTSGRFGCGRSVARPPGGRYEHRPQLRGGPLGTRLVALVHHDEVGDLEQPGLDGLDLVAHLGCLEHDRRVRGGRHLDLALAGPDGLDEHEVEARGVQHGRSGRGRGGEAARMAARRHRADEHVAVARVGLHPNAVAEERAPGDRRGRVHGHDRDRPTGSPNLRDERCDEGRLARARRPGDAHEMRPAGLCVELAHRRLAQRRAVLDRGQEPGEGQSIAADGGPRQGVGAGGGVLRHLSRGSARSSAGSRRPGRWSCPVRRPPPRRPP